MCLLGSAVLFICLDFPAYLSDINRTPIETGIQLDIPEEHELIFHNKPGTAIHIDYFNDILINNNTTLIDPGQLSGTDKIVLQGWAYDSFLELPASALSFQLNDGKIISAIYGNARPDVGEVLDNPLLNHIGFEIQVDINEFIQGDNLFRIYVLDKNGMTYGDYLKIIITKD